MYLDTYADNMEHVIIFLNHILFYDFYFNDSFCNLQASTFERNKN